MPNSVKTAKPSEPPSAFKNQTHAYQRYQKVYISFAKKDQENLKNEVDNLKEQYTNLVNNTQQQYLMSHGKQLPNTMDMKKI